MKPLRVLYVDRSLGFGGAVKSLGITLPALEGVRPFVLTTQGPDQTRLWFSRVPVRRFRRWAHYAAFTRMRRIAGALPGPLARAGQAMVSALDLAVVAAGALRMALLIRIHRIDLVHLNNGFGPLEALLAARMAGVPVVAHLRDFVRPRPRFDAGTQAWPAHVIACSAAVAASVRGTPAERTPVTVVHDPVDVDAVAAAAGERDGVRRAWGIAAGEVAVAIFGRVVPWKGQLQFARAMAKAMRADARLRAVVVGDGADGGAAYLEQVRAEARASGLEDRWTFAGYRADVEACYAAADVVVHASVTPEPFGMVVPEAMAAGRPVIAADAGGPAEVVEHGVHGLRVPPGDVDALADAVLALAADPALRAAMGELGRAHARTRFRVEHGARAVAGVYGRVLGGAAAGAEASARVETPSVAGARG